MLPNITPGIALLALLTAALLGALHALSPGHGKAVVGAYLIGSRGSARHAVFLGLTVTITHTLGVFALGLVTLLASEFIVPEQLYPVLSTISGALVVLIGLSLLIRRIRGAVISHESHHRHHHEDGTHGHSHAIENNTGITWKSLLCLGISGGLLPCPSALVVLLAAIALHRVGYGLLLVIAFSIGLATTLTVVGLILLQTRDLVRSRMSSPLFDRVVGVLPVFSAFVITGAGAVIVFGALQQANVRVPTMFLSTGPSILSASAIGILALGLVYGLKHATEVDHIVAVSTIVSEHRKLTRAALVGGLWGAGHTMSLMVVGACVLVLRIAIPEAVAGWLEFGVALMIIALGTAAIRRALRARAAFHTHTHTHGELTHSHVHFHEERVQHAASTGFHTHAVKRVGLKPILVGAMHGLAGSAALTLLVLTQIKSSLLGILYLAVFGVGSMFGMLVMSSLIGLPFVVSSRKLTGIHYSVQMLAGLISVAFGIWYAYQTGFGGS